MADDEYGRIDEFGLGDLFCVNNLLNEREDTVQRRTGADQYRHWNLGRVNAISVVPKQTRVGPSVDSIPKTRRPRRIALRLWDRWKISLVPFQDHLDKLFQITLGAIREVTFGFRQLS